MHCRNCGFENREEAIFCEMCGDKLQVWLNTQTDQMIPMKRSKFSKICVVATVASFAAAITVILLG